MKFHGDLPFGEKEFRAILAQAQTVKSNSVREVLRAGKFFIKHDLRRDRSFKEEYENALFLEKRGIPVVRHLGYAESASGHYLVTEALENALDVAGISANGGFDAAFLKDYLAFLGILREKRLCHKDLHGGNILFVPGTRKFFLVDVRAVRKGLFAIYRDGDVWHLITEARLYLPRETAFDALKKLGARRPEKFWRSEIRRDFRHTLGEWDKRRIQIMEGYWRFTRVEGGLVLDHAARADEIASARRRPAKRTFFQARYFLLLNHLPAARVVGYDRLHKEILMPETRDFELADPASVEDYRERLRFCGVETREEDWRRDAAGHTVLTDWTNVAEKLW